MNAARDGVTNWTLLRDRSPVAPHAFLDPPHSNVNGLSPIAGVARTVVATPLPALLRTAGYRTIHCGKAHHAARGTPGEDPRALGFDVNIAGHAAGGPGSYLGTHDFSAAWRQGDRIWNVPGLEAYHGQDIRLDEALAREAVRAVEVAVHAGRPFYLSLTHYAVHAPWEADERFLAAAAVELFDVAADIGEERDLAAERPPIVADLAGRLARRLAERGAGMPDDRRTRRPVTVKLPRRPAPKSQSPSRQRGDVARHHATRVWARRRR